MYLYEKSLLVTHGIRFRQADTQELSEIDSTRGPKVEVDILGILVPLIDGVLRP